MTVDPLSWYWSWASPFIINNLIFLVEMIGAQGTVGETSSKPNASVEKSTNAKKSVTQHVSPGSCTWPNVAGNQRTLNTQGPVMYDINALAILNAMRNMGYTGMDPGQGLPGQMNPPQMPGQPAPGTTGTLPETGANQMNNRTVIWKGETNSANKNAKKWKFHSLNFNIFAQNIDEVVLKEYPQSILWIKDKKKLYEVNLMITLSLGFILETDHVINVAVL